MSDPVPLPLRHRGEGSSSQIKTDSSGEKVLKKYPIIFISSKPLSTHAYDVLNTVGFLRVFDYKKYATWTILDFIEGLDYAFFNISENETLAYLSSQFKLMTNLPICILKRSHETVDETWITTITENCDATIIDHIPNEYKKDVLYDLLTSRIHLNRPQSRLLKIAKSFFLCFKSLA